MRYVTATFGAVFIFVAIILVGFLVNVFLPPPLQRVISLPLGPVFISANVSVLLGFALALPAAIHSFRSTLKREAKKADERLSTSQLKLPNSN